MSYIPIPKAPGEPIEKYLDAELNDLARALVEPKESVTLQTLYTAPAKPAEGMVCKADGTNWNPGSGAGTYQYRGGSWRAWEGGGSSSNAFSSIAVSGQTTVAADSSTDTLTLVAGSNITITTDAGADSITIASSGGAGHDAVTVSDTSSIDLTLTGQALSAAAIFGTTAGTVCQGNDSRLSDARTPTSHDHSANKLAQANTHESADTDSATTALHHTIGTGANQAAAGNHTHAQLHDAVTVADSTSIDLTLTGQQISAAAIFGTTSGTVCQGNDSRLSDARTPTSHTHGNITNAGAIGSTANLPVITTTSGVLTTGTFGTTANTFCQGDDSRLSDARTPTAHNQAWSTITGTPTTLSGYGITDAQPLDTQLTSLAALAYTGNGTKFVRVNSGETGFELVTVAGGGNVTADDTSTTVQNIVAYSTTGGANITELTGTQGDILYHNGTSWVKLGAGTNGYFLRTMGAGANPKWWPDAVYNQSTANQGAGFASDTYVTGSNVLVPNGGIKVGTRYYCMARVSKTAAGTATPIVNLRIGTAGTTADTSRGTLTWTAGTAAIDDGILEIWMTVTAAGASGTVRTVGQITHKLSVTGLTGTAAVSETEVADSGTFDTTTNGLYVGISLNGGASAAWTVHMVQAKVENLA